MNHAVLSPILGSEGLGAVEMSSQDTDIGASTLAFLGRHRLAPTPQNYALAYLALTDPGSPIGLAVNAITTDGYRMRQDEADMIAGSQASATFAAAAPRGESEEAAALRHQTLRLGEWASSAAAATGDFARDLSVDAEALCGSGADTVKIVSRMVDRSRHTEAELNAAVAEVAALREKLEEARDDAKRDQLTGLANRRSINEYLAQLAIARSDYVVGLCDIDHFKAINDRFGHGVGDRVLKRVADVLAAACAPHFVGRWGGEEFVVIMEANDPAAGAALLEAARSDLAKRRFKLRETDEPMGLISFSGGVAFASAGEPCDGHALRRADAALYRAKGAGRNRIELDLGSVPAPVVQLVANG